MFKNILDKLYKVTNSKILAFIGAPFIYSLLFLKYFFAYKFSKRKSAMTYEDAMELLTTHRTIPNTATKIKHCKVNSNVDLSIIVPVYNVEKYFHQCINSILTQNTDYKFEVIIIDDGSTDMSSKYVDEYKYRDSITVLHQRNSGLSSARNSGLDMASGKYVMFVDSDDILIDGAVEKLLYEAYSENCDIVSCDFIDFIEPRELNKFNGRSIEKYYRSSELDRSFVTHKKGFACGKVYKRELWENIRFPERIFYEDTINQFILFRLCKKYSFIPYRLYGYRKNPSSITSTVVNSEKSFDSLWVVLDMLKKGESLCLNVDDELYVVTLIHLGKILYSRTSKHSDEILLAELAIANAVLWSLKRKLQYTVKLTTALKKVEAAILRCDFKAWKFYSKVS